MLFLRVMPLSRAIVRLPGPTFAAGLTSAALGAPHLDTALEQHALYCQALRQCGLSVCTLPADGAYPDGTFVEDTAVIATRMAIVTRPGAPSRAGEVSSIRPVLAELELDVHDIEPPGTVDGGDVCLAEEHFFIGVSRRTNEEGARQLAALVNSRGYHSSIIDVRRSRSLLHLKSGIAYLGEGRLVVTPELAQSAQLRGYERVLIAVGEEYAANCVRINDHVLIAADHPRFAATLDALGYKLLPLAMSEFRKMDGGLSCLSLRF